MKNVTSAIVFFLTSSAVAFAQAVPTPAPAALSADDIYFKSIGQLRTLSEPAYIEYTLDFEGSILHHSGKTVKRIIYRTSDGVSFSHTISENGKPPPATQLADSISEKNSGLGPDFMATMQRNAGKKPSQESIFGLSLDAMATPEPGVVRAIYNSHYAVHLAGVEPDRPCAESVYHLRLQPRHNPEDNPVREMWIDTATFNVCRVSLDVMVNEGPFHAPVSADVTLSPHGDYWLADALKVEGHSRFLLLSASMAFRVRFSNIGFPEIEPAWMFDQALYTKQTGHKAGSGFSLIIH